MPDLLSAPLNSSLICNCNCSSQWHRTGSGSLSLWRTHCSPTHRSLPIMISCIHKECGWGQYGSWGMAAAATPYRDEGPKCSPRCKAITHTHSQQPQPHIVVFGGNTLGGGVLHFRLQQAPTTRAAGKPAVSRRPAATIPPGFPAPTKRTGPLADVAIQTTRHASHRTFGIISGSPSSPPAHHRCRQHWGRRDRHQRRCHRSRCQRRHPQLLLLAPPPPAASRRLQTRYAVINRSGY